MFIRQRWTWGFMDFILGNFATNTEEQQQQRSGCQHLQKLVDFLFWMFLSVHQYRINQLIPFRNSIGTSSWWKLNGFWKNPEPFCAHRVFRKGLGLYFYLTIYSLIKTCRKLWFILKFQTSTAGNICIPEDTFSWKV